MPQFKFIPIETNATSTPIDTNNRVDGTEQWAAGSPPMITGAPINAMQFGEITEKPRFSFTPTISAEEAALATELRPFPNQMKELLPESSFGVPTAMSAMQSLTFNAEEMRDMLTAIDPNIEVNIGPKGGIYVNQPGKDRFVINKPGLSTQDAINLGTTVAIGLGSGLGGTAARRVAYEAIMQTIIEAGQYSAGGEFNPEEIALAGVGSAAGEVPGMITRSRASVPVRQAALDAGATPESAADITRIAEAQGRPVEIQADILTDVIQPDVGKVRAAEELNILDETPARVISGHPRYVEIERALGRIPGSSIAESDIGFIRTLRRKTEDFVQTYGGLDATDLPGVTERVRNEITSTLEGSIQQSNKLYDEIALAVPKRTLVTNTDALDILRKGIRSEAIDVGGINKISQLEREIYRELESIRAGGRPMTYARLDQMRKRVGEKLGAASKGMISGDEAAFELSRLYGLLTEAQGQVLQDVGGDAVGDMWIAAKSLVSERKAYEDIVKRVAGKNFEKSIIPSLANAINNMAEGGVDNFNRIMLAIPENMRGEAVSSAMVNVFGIGAQGVNPGKFATTWRNITRNKTARDAFFQHMPEESGIFLDNLAVIFRSYADSNAIPKTGVINSLEMFNADGGIVSKMLPLLTGRGGNMMGNLIETGGSASAKAQQRAAADMLDSPQLKRIIANAANGSSTKRLEDHFMKTEAFKAWTSTIPANLKTRILSIGLVEYLFEGGSNTEETGEQ